MIVSFVKTESMNSNVEYFINSSNSRSISWGSLGCLFNRYCFQRRYQLTSFMAVWSHCLIKITYFPQAWKGLKILCHYDEKILCHYDDLNICLQVRKLLGDKHEVTSLARSPDHSHLAVGYRNGYIRVFDLLDSEDEDPVTFCCHRRAVTALAYDHDGMRLVAGSQVLMWVCDVKSVCKWMRA